MHGRLFRQLDTLRHVPDTQLVAAQDPAVDLSKGLVGLFSCPGEVERIDPILYLLKANALYLAFTPLRHQVAADGASVALQRGGAQALALVGHVLGDGIGKQHFDQSNLSKIPDETNGSPPRFVWDFCL